MTLEEVFSYIDRSEEQMIALWKNIVEIESESSNIDGVNKLARHLDTYCTAMGMNTRKYIYESAGSSLVAFTQERKEKPVVLMAHMDTVHKAGSFGNDLFIDENGLVKGPGVYDCKGGIVIALLVVKALEYAGYDKRQIKLVFTGDEEVAHSLSSGKSKKVYEDEASGAVCAFNCESGSIKGDVITSRKGGSVFHFEVQGVESHAGHKPLDGASAVLEAAKKIVEIQEKSDPNYVLYNCGKLNSDNGVNIIAGKCTFDIAIRFTTNAQYQEAVAFLQSVADKKYDSRVTTVLTQQATFSAMEKTQNTDKLFNLFAKKTKEISGEEINQLFVGGCSDSAYVTSLGVPVLCGVGAMGEYSHSRQEYARRDSITIQAKRIVSTILSLEEEEWL